MTTKESQCLHDWKYEMMASVRICKKCNGRQIRLEVPVDIQYGEDNAFGLTNVPLTQKQKELLIR